LYKYYLSRHAIANVRNPKFSRARGDGYEKPTGPREGARRRKNPWWRGEELHPAYPEMPKETK